MEQEEITLLRTELIKLFDLSDANNYRNLATIRNMFDKKYTK